MPARTLVLTAHIASLVSLVIASLAGVLVLMQSGLVAFILPTAQPVVRAFRVELVDENLRVRGVIDGHGIWLFDEKGQQRAAMTVEQGGATQLALGDQHGTFIGMGAGDQFVLPGLTMQDKNGHPRILVNYPDGATRIQLLDESGQIVSQSP